LRMNSFIALVRLVGFGLVLPLALDARANAQDMTKIERRCLSIADVNARVECLETGIVPSSAATSAPIPSPTRQQLTGPSFDCRLARSSIERAICSDMTLSDWDSQMGRLFQQALQLARDRQSLLENQRLWLVQRNSACGAVPDTAIWSCLLEATKARAGALEKAITAATEANQTNQPAAPAPTISPQSHVETAQANTSLNPANSPAPRALQNDRPQNLPPQNEDMPYASFILASILSLIIALIVFNIIRRNRRVAAERDRVAAEQQRFELHVQNLVARYGEAATTRIGDDFKPDTWLQREMTANLVSRRFVVT
jgi:uncharacterized protein